MTPSLQQSSASLMQVRALDDADRLTFSAARRCSHAVLFPQFAMSRRQSSNLSGTAAAYYDLPSPSGSSPGTLLKHRQIVLQLYDHPFRPSSFQVGPTVRLPLIKSSLVALMCDLR